MSVFILRFYYVSLFCAGNGGRRKNTCFRLLNFPPPEGVVGGQPFNWMYAILSKEYPRKAPPVDIPMFKFAYVPRTVNALLYG